MRHARIPSVEMLEPRLLLDASPAMVSGTVWLDNGDGVRHPSEPGVAGVTVRLRDAIDREVATRVTDSSGVYLFSGLSVGTYSLEFLAPDDMVFTLPGQDSHAARDTGCTPFFWIGLGTFDAGLVRKATPWGLKISEVMYSPPCGFGHAEEDFEFIDLANRGPSHVDLMGVRFIDGVAFDFTGSAVTSLDPGQHVLVVKNRAAFESRYGTGLPIAGEYTGRLNDDGESLNLEGPNETTVDAVSYRPSDALDAGGGFSLVRNEADPLGSWVVGAAPGGTPGLDEGAAVNTAAIAGQVISSVNQGGIPNVPVRLCTASGDLVATTRASDAGIYGFFGLRLGQYFVEVQCFDGTWWKAPTVTLAACQYERNVNASLTPAVPLVSVVASFWMDTDGDGVRNAAEGDAWGEFTAFLTDASGQVVSAKLVWSDITFDNLLPGRYRLQLVPGDDFALTLKDQGADELLDSDFDPTTGLTDVFTLTSGRELTGLGAGFIDTAVTQNLRDYLRVTEFMYDPPARRWTEPNVDNNEFEFIELTNTGPVPLVMRGVRFIKGVSFDFSGSSVQVLAPGGRVLIVKNQTAFQARYGAGLPIAGEYGGRLSNDGEEIELDAPINKIIEKFSYSPTERPVARTNGSGSSMTRNLEYRVDEQDGWFPSSVWGGTPGADDPLLTMPLPNVVINEVCANAGATGGDWIELHNLTGSPVGIGGWSLATQSGRYDIPNGTVLGALGYMVIPESTFSPGGGTLPNDLVLDGVKGGDLTLVAIVGGILPRAVDRIGFGPSGPNVTFGRYTRNTGQVAFVKMASPTPGGANSLPMINPDDPVFALPVSRAVVINEVCANALAAGGDWVELQNLTNAPVSIGGWCLVGQGGIYEFPAGTSIGPNNYVVIPESAFNPGGGTLPSDLVLGGDRGGNLTLSALVDSVLPRTLDHVKYASSDHDVTFGRYVKSTGEPVFVEMASPTRGGPNSPPRVGPLIINEVMYHPEDDGIEWVELYNMTDQDVLLCDPQYPFRGWLVVSSLEFMFPAGATAPAHGYVLTLSGGDPEWFRQHYNVPASVPVYSLPPCDFGLDNSGDKVRLIYPCGGDWSSGAPYHLVDQLVYDDEPPWPKSPDGHGPSLERIWANAYGDDLMYWAPGPVGGTPGRPNSTDRPPRLVGVKVNDQKHLGPAGIAPGATGIHTLALTFSQPVVFNVGSALFATVRFVGDTEITTGWGLWPKGVTGSGTTVVTITLNPGAVINTWLKVMLQGSGGAPVDIAGRRLDGEAKPGGSGRGYIYGNEDLPTGDGTAGGLAVFYVGSLPGDFDGDGSVGGGDLEGFLAAWQAGSPDADFGGTGLGPSGPDGQVTPSDLDTFISVYNAAVAGGRSREALPKVVPQSGGATGPLSGGSSPTPLPSADEVAAAAAAAREPALEVLSPASPEDALASAAPIALVPAGGADAVTALGGSAPTQASPVYGAGEEVAPPRPDPVLAAAGGLDLLALPALTL